MSQTDRSAWITVSGPTVRNSENKRVSKQALLISAFRIACLHCFLSSQMLGEINSGNSFSFGKKWGEINWGNGFPE